MQANAMLDCSDPFQRESLRFSFMDVIQKDLDRIVSEWNSHRIQGNKKYNLFSGKPDKMFYMPQEFQSESFHCEFKHDVLSEVEHELQKDGADSELIDLDFVKLVSTLTPNWETASNFEEGLYIYGLVIDSIRFYEENL